MRHASAFVAGFLSVFLIAASPSIRVPPPSISNGAQTWTGAKTILDDAGVSNNFSVLNTITAADRNGTVTTPPYGFIGRAGLGWLSSGNNHLVAGTGGGAASGMMLDITESSQGVTQIIGPTNANPQGYSANAIISLGDSIGAKLAYSTTYCFADGTNAQIVTSTSQVTAGSNAVTINSGTGTISMQGAIQGNSTKSRGTITLSAGSGTATVLSGAICVCTDTTSNVSVKCAVASTTLTATGSGTDVIAYHCL